MDNKISEITSQPLPTSGRLKEIEMEIQFLGQQSVNNFIKMGELLHEAKSNFFKENKTGWEKWCESNCLIGYRTVKRLVRIYEKFGNWDTGVPKIGIRALDVLARFDNEDIVEMQEQGIIVNGELKKIEELKQREIEELSKENSRLKEGYENTISEIKRKREDDIKALKQEIQQAKEEGKKEVATEEIINIRKREVDRLEAEYLMKKRSMDDDFRKKYDILDRDRKALVERIENVVAREGNLSSYEVKLSNLKKEEEQARIKIEKLKQDYGVAKKGSEYILEIKELLKSAELLISDMRRINSSPHSGSFLNNEEILPYIEFTLKELEVELTTMSKKINKSASIIDVNFK